MNANDCTIDIRFDIGEKGMAKIREIEEPLALTKKLRKIECVEGVGFHPTSITLCIKSELMPAVMAMAKAQIIINEELT